MSWDSYIDNLLGQCKDKDGQSHCDKACIIGLDGGGAWTSAGHHAALNLTATEGATIARCFKSKDFTPFMSTGIHAEGLKYQFLRESEGKIVNCKAKGKGALTLQASKTAVVIGHCPEGKQPGNTNKGVAVIADYLETMSM